MNSVALCNINTGILNFFMALSLFVVSAISLSSFRLYWLIKLVGGVEVKEFSSKQHAQKRAKLLTQFKAGKIHV